MLAVHELVSQAPALRQVLASFAAPAVGDSRTVKKSLRSSKTRRAKIRGNWQGIAHAGGKWVSVFSGGLPTLGKRK